jgi:hypothetical protein
MEGLVPVQLKPVEQVILEEAVVQEQEQDPQVLVAQGEMVL